MSTLKFPAPIAAYFAADTLSPEAVARCFAVNAVVKDEGHTHTGRDAIRAWKADASAKYTYTTEPLSITQQDGQHLVRSRVTGNFPGSPIDLRYRFHLEGDLIASLQIAS
ncbi:nuclear transport factor 2 family protein [Pigmentiphaga litoralis]|uniref:SnoaL-like domain-containing protein n=1 Tax=Pigmentiphaga litoralis TaxID=516702 RepID=A0A7Y9LM77_9BURK|nr:nuclear transport factor 2 family protein [Pigmentiphaga litoralis]NYE24563.1 hypothetical protein [Pigmentiphaga litoralis]NYE81823.1 hypothetical protein [Pigmentiphaga litoralis]